VRCCGTGGVLKVMMNVFMFLLPPESSLTEMLTMSVMPCGSSSLSVSSLSVNKCGTLDNTFAGVQCPRGLVVTGQPAKLPSLLTVRLWEAVVTWMIKSDRRHLISFTVPIAIFMALSMRNGHSLESGCS